MRKLRKELLRLDKQTRYREELEYFEDEYQGYKEARRRPRSIQSSEEVFKRRHCQHFVCPLPYGGHHRHHCLLWTQWTMDTLHAWSGGYR